MHQNHTNFRHGQMWSAFEVPSRSPPHGGFWIHQALVFVHQCITHNISTHRCSRSCWCSELSSNWELCFRSAMLHGHVLLSGSCRGTCATAALNSSWRACGRQVVSLCLSPCKGPDDCLNLLIVGCGCFDEATKYQGRYCSINTLQVTVRRS